MSDRPNPLDELKKGLTHIARAAKAAVDELPTKDLEDAVVTGVREVGRALNNVKDTVESQVLGKKSSPPPANETRTRVESSPPAEDENKKNEGDGI